MRRVNFKKNVLAVAVAMAAGYMGSAGAHWAPGQPVTATTPTTPLGADNAFDVYHTSCYTGTATDVNPPEVDVAGPANRLRANVAGVGGTGIFKVTVGADRTPATAEAGALQASCTDFNNGNSLLLAGATSAYCNPTNVSNTENSAIVAQGNGDYDIVVAHPLGVGTVGGQNAAGVYNLKFHCETSTGAHTATGVGAIFTPGQDYVHIINY
jgi:hypothetical protein